MKTKFFLILLSSLLLSCGNSLSPFSPSRAVSASIVGGQDATASDGDASLVAGSTVALMMDVRGAYRQFCTGTLVSSNLVLTATHCLLKMDLRNVKAFVGANLPSEETAPGLVQIEKGYINPDYILGGENQVYNDIAFFKLSTPFAGAAKPAAILENSDFIQSGLEVLVAGFGITAENPMTIPKTLQFTKAPVAKKENTLVVLDQRAGRGACAGDSGGPLYLKGADGLIVFGATRGPHRPARDCQQFGDFTNASMFKDFIAEAVDRLGAEAPKFAVPLAN